MNDLLKNIIKQFMPFAQKQIGFKNPPRLFLRNDPMNAQNPLGKTAFYDPGAKSVTLYITGRHPKDILRSLGHELVHHKQNCDGEFSDSDDMGPGYAQRSPHLRDMEEKANLHGSMCLRDFEDMLKKENTIYYEHLQKGEKTMSTKDWKNKEISQLLSEAWGFKFNSLQEFDEFNGTGEIQAEGEEEIEEGGRDYGRKKPHQSKKYKDEDPPPADESLEEGEEDDQRAARKQRKGREDHQRKIREDDDESLEEAEEEVDEGLAGAAAGMMAGGPVGAYLGHKAQDVADEYIDDDDEDEQNEEKELEEDESVETLQEAITKILRKHLKG
tara:strand:- start:153 stop:1136 length:984 start_codon:yes stop_codon:yes gene_type:complete